MRTAGVAAIVPAAGRAVRFGGGKLTALLHGEPLIDHTLRSLIDGGADRVVVVTSDESSLDTAILLAHPRVSSVVNPDPSRGMFSSVLCGLAAVEGGAFLVLPADMPFVRAATVAAVASTTRRDDAAVVPVFAGRRGHPLGLPGRLRGPLLGADPTEHLKGALAGLGIVAREFAVDDPGVLRDVDEPKDLDSGR